MRPLSTLVTYLLVAMLCGMVFSRFLCMMSGMKVMPMRYVRVMPRFLVVARFVMLGCLTMVSRGMLMMFCCLFVVFCAFMCGHTISPVLILNDE